MAQMHDDPLDDLLALPVVATEQVTRYEERCPKGCRNGRFISWAGRDLGPCHACKGKGVVEFRTSPEARAKVKERSAARKVALAEESLGRFRRDYPAEAAWIEANKAGFDFARAMADAVAKYEELTENQMAAVRRCMAKEAARKEAQQQSAALVGQVDVTKVQESFEYARSHGAKKASLRAGTVIFSLAPAGGQNPGAIYVKRTEGSVYLGKITGPAFKPSFSCTPADVTSIQEAAADPKEAALKFGKETGTCAICGAELTNPESIARSIGPICLGKFGW